MDLTITPLTPVFAGEVGAIDLRQVRDQKSLEAIRAGMDKYAVLVFRDQELDHAAHKRACSALKPLLV